MEALWQDVRYGLRLLLKNPGFTAVAVLVSALGIGANTAIFSVVNAVLLRPLPYSHPERLVKVRSVDTKRGGSGSNLSFPNFADYRAQNTTLEAISVFSDRTSVLTGVGAPERIVGMSSSADLFDVLGVQPLLGRTFTSDDEKSPSTVILSYGMWQRRLGGDPDIIGRQISLNYQQKTIIGVLKPSFTFPFSAEQLEFFESLDPKGQREIQRGADFFEAIGRLKPGVAITDAEADMQTIAARLEQQYPEDNDGASVRLISAHEDLVGNLRMTFLILLGAVGFVLLIACANVASLQLARSMGRSREIAIRIALGASRWRVIRQLMTENLVLSILGGAVGLLLAVWTLEFISAFVPSDIPRVSESDPDRTVLVFTLSVSVLTGLIFGLAPALRASRANLNESLKEGGRGATEGRARLRVRSLLVVSEVGLSLVLLIGAGLLLKSFVRLRYTNPGFNATRVLTGSITLPSARYPKDEEISRFYRDVIDRASHIPGVESVGAILPLPFSENSISTTFTVEGQPDPGPGERPIAGARIITPDYPRAMGIRLISGRPFNDRDNAGAPKVVLINEALAKRFFPDENPIGRRLLVGLNDIKGEIVGVLGGVRSRNLEKEPGPEYYVPLEQVPVNTMSLVVRATTSDLMSLGASLGSSIHEIDKELPLYRVRPMESLVANSVARQRFSMTLIIAFAGLALALAAVGIFSVMSFLVAQRTHEIGVRMALGAQPNAIVRMVIRYGMSLTLAGVGSGLLGAFALTRLMRELLFQVSPTDSMTFIVVPVVLTGVALAASFVPARRATRVDPMVALRCE